MILCVNTVYFVFPFWMLYYIVVCVPSNFSFNKRHDNALYSMIRFIHIIIMQLHAVPNTFSNFKLNQGSLGPAIMLPPHRQEINNFFLNYITLVTLLVHERPKWLCLCSSCFFCIWSKRQSNITYAHMAALIHFVHTCTIPAPNQERSCVIGYMVGRQILLNIASVAVVASLEDPRYWLN